MSTATVHGTLSMTSGARYIGALMMCSPLFVLTSSETESPKSPSWKESNRTLNSSWFTRILSVLMSASHEHEYEEDGAS